MNINYLAAESSRKPLAENQKSVMTLAEFANFAGIAKSTAYKLTHKNLIPFTKPNGKLVYITIEDALAYLQRNRVASIYELANAAANYVVLNQTGKAGVGCN